MIITGFQEWNIKMKTSITVKNIRKKSNIQTTKIMKKKV